MDSPVLTELSEIVSSTCQLEVIRFEFDYMSQRRHGGSKRPPPKIDSLVREWQLWLDHLPPTDMPVLLSGKSLGGRVATMLNSPQTNKPSSDTKDGSAATAAQNPWQGVICFGYPFHPPRNITKLRTEHLKEPCTPTLIVQGSHDPFGKVNEVESYPLSKDITLEWIPTGNHDLRPLKKSGLSHSDALKQSALAINAFIAKTIF